ncbi:MAG: hypothetical protein KU37_08970 [Sulfuricurvum sp. PC08-66]|nr:MAG: hypothetical protein KU37_08970 [Sulfuricurvum sp. PC08-66]
MSAHDILYGALELPIDERIILADAINQSLNPIDKEIEKAWLVEVENRLKLLDDGKLETISYQDFFA